MNNTGHAGFSLKAELEKIQSLPRGKRWEYVWEYYRTAFLLVVFFLFFAGAILSFLVTGLTNILFRQDTFSIAFAAPGYSGSQAWTADCLEAIGYDEKKEDFLVLTSAPLSETSDEFRITATVWLANRQPDIFIVNESSYRHLLELEALADLGQLLPEELLENYPLTDSFALDISGTPLAEETGLTEEAVYLCLYADGGGLERALDVVEYILTEE